MGAEAPLALTVPIGLVLALPAVASAVAAVGGWTGRLRRTGRLGVHTLAASASDRGFATANRVAAPVVAGAAAVGTFTALVALLLPLDVLTVIVVGALGLVGMLVLLYVAAAMGERAARALPLPARTPSTAGGFTCTVDSDESVSTATGAPTGAFGCGQTCATCSGAPDCRIAALAPTPTADHT